MKDRLLKFLNREQLSSARFAEIIGVQPSSISHILSGRNKPGFDFIQKILYGYPSLNAEWLILGKGNMFKQEVRQGNLFAENIQESFSDHDEQAIPVEDHQQFPITGPGDEDATAHSDTNVTKQFSRQDYTGNLTNESVVTNVNISKSIEKIVILYSDKSFSEYSPEPTGITNTR
jgi:transcriptional regulator with XRE-family HTH domain